MDPDATYEALVAHATAYEGAVTRHEEQEAADQVVILFNALDEWLRNGGFMPTAWTPRIQENKE